jgi:hypothetical protein
MRGAMGPGGSSITRGRDGPHGAWDGQPSGGKTWPPALPFPQMRQGMALLVHEALQGGTMSQRRKACEQRVQRHELARF